MPVWSVAQMPPPQFLQFTAAVLWQYSTTTPVPGLTRPAIPAVLAPEPLIVQFSLAQWEMSVQSFTSPAMAARNVLALWALPPETVHPETVPYLFSSPTMAPQPPAVVDLRSM